MSFFERLKLALTILFGGALPTPPALPPPEAPQPPPAPPKPTAEQQHAAALFLLGLMQREGRFLDFVQEDIASFSDTEVGGVARLVHDGCRKVIAQYLPLTPVVTQSEGAPMDIPTGFDANRYRLTGNVTGAGPWKGNLKHHGWMAAKIELPDVPTTVDVKVLAPAEVELP